MNFTILRALGALGCALLCACPTYAALRGYNLGSMEDRTAAQYNQMYADGARIVRLSFATRPLASYDKAKNKVTMNAANLELMHDNIRWARDAGLKVIIDPHRMFGSSSIYTIPARSDFWTDSDYGNAWAQMWEILVRDELKGYGSEIWAYELINEPGTYDSRKTAGNQYLNVDINAVYKNCITKILKHDTNTQLSLMFYEEDFGYRNPSDPKVDADDEYIVKSPSFYAPSNRTGLLVFGSHIYWPLGFTHQGIGSRTTDVHWPYRAGTDPAADSYMTTANLEKRLDWIESWRVAKGVPASRMLIGEWGVTQGTTPSLAWNGNSYSPGNGADDWHTTIYTRMRDRSYNWCIHEYRGGNASFDITQPAARYTFVKAMLRNTAPGSLPGN
jgi:hypothetical protein